MKQKKIKLEPVKIKVTEIKTSVQLQAANKNDGGYTWVG